MPPGRVVESAPASIAACEARSQVGAAHVFMQKSGVEAVAGADRIHWDNFLRGTG